MKKKAILFIAISMIAIHALAQKQGQARIDSLLQQLPRSKEDTNKIKLMNDLSFTYRTINSDEGIKFGMESLSLAVKLQWKQGIASANDALGINYHFGKADYPKALEYYLKSLKVSEEINDKHRMSMSYNRLGTIYNRLSENEKALDYYQKSLQIARESGDRVSMQDVMLNIGALYQKQKDYPGALDYFNQALKINQALGNKSDCAETLNAIGFLYRLKKDFSKTHQYCEEAVKYYEADGNKLAMANELEDIGDLYRQQRDYARALTYLFRALGLQKELNEKRSVSYNYGVIALTYFMIGTDTDKSALNKLFAGKKSVAIKLSRIYADSSVEIQKELGDLYLLQDTYISMSRGWEQIGDYKGALECYKKYITIRDSTYNLEKDKKLIQLSMKYEFAKKQATDSLQHAVENNLNQIRLQKQKTFTYAGFIGMALVAFLLFFVFKNYNNQRKSNRKLQAAQKEILEQKNRAEQSERFKQQFLANMSHEIRTPMNAVMGMTGLLIDKNPRSDQQHYLEGIKKSSDILLHIINDILDLSKIESGKMELEKTDFSLRETVEQVLITLHHKADEKGLQLLGEIDSGIPDVLIGDPVRINQILLNLAGNAIKFTEKGSVQIRVKLTGGGQPSLLNIRFSITDTGIGIPKEKLETVFESFKQVNTSDTRKYGGTGLGLTISRQLVELHGGEIMIESEEGAGTTFSFALSFAEGSAERLQQLMNAHANIDGSILNGLRILIADDNEYNRIVADDTLHSKADVSTLTASNGHEAIELLKAHDFDVILMDVQMPEMNGFEATKFIRENMSSPKKDIPIIALTASVLRTDLDKCRQVGMNSYIPKPFHASQLIRGIAEVLDIKIRTIEHPVDKKEAESSGYGKVTDMSYLNDFCETDEEKMQKYIMMFLASAPVLVGKINKALAVNDFIEIADQLHGFKTKFIMMGMKSTGSQSFILEQQCRNDTKSDTFHADIKGLLGEVERAINELT
jgi:signal transduction histidine kinase/FixJ family two-component response regulator/HPt (histidine-containing phosphotransfer) domain-containing protein